VRNASELIGGNSHTLYIFPKEDQVWIGEALNNTKAEIQVITGKYENLAL